MQFIQTVLSMIILILLAVPSPLPAQSLPEGWVAENVTPVAYLDLKGASTFKITVHEKAGQWYLYLGHYDRNIAGKTGWSVVDVTDPGHPSIINFLQGPAGSGWLTGQVEIGDHYLITATEIFGVTDEEQLTRMRGTGGFYIWDISEPAAPVKIGEYHTSGLGTHRNFYSGGRYVHLAASEEGYEGNIYVIVDIADPAHPVEVSRWWVEGQHIAGGETPSEAYISQHGPPYISGNEAYLAYGSAGMIVLDISDVKQPKQISRLDFSPPFLGNIGVHTVLPLPTQGIALVNSESIAEDCREPLNHATVVDISDLKQPRLLSIFPLPVPPSDAPYQDFCDKGARFGPHNLNHLQHNPFVEKHENLVYLTYFNAGLRIFNLENPRQPVETGYFIPPDPKERWMPVPRGKLVSQTEDVLVDTRGFIYITHKNQGLWILRYTGER